MYNLKKIFSVLLTGFLLYLYILPVYPADTKSLITLSAEKVDKETAIGDIDQKILDKFIPVKITISNRSNNSVILSNKFYYTDKSGNEFAAPSSAVIFEATKRHTIRRAVIWGLIGLGPLSFVTVPASLAHSLTKNSNLNDNIEKINCKASHLYPKDYFSGYILVPKRHRDVSYIILKEISSDKGDSFDLKAPVNNNDL